MKPLTRIVLLGDILRVQPNNDHQANNFIRFFYELFRGQITTATGIEVELALAGDAPGFDRDIFFSLAGYDKPSFANWLRLASGECRQEAGEYFAECYRNALLISYEAGSLSWIMERHGIPYLDMRISPIRFLDDLYLAFKSNIPEVRERLCHYQITDEQIYCTANKLKAYYLIRLHETAIKRSVSTSGLSSGSLLLCGQTAIDLSLAKEGKIVGFLERAEAVNELCKQYPNVYYRPHPNATPTDPGEKFIRSLPGVIKTAGNIYQLLCDDNLDAVAALSSGVLHEAPYFGKKTHIISHKYIALAQSGSSTNPGAYIMTRDAYYSPAFWKDVLSPCVPVRECPSFSLSGRENYLRNLLGKWWGYEIGKVNPVEGTVVLDAAKRLANLIDPSHRIRNWLDPDGRKRKNVKKAIGEK